MMKAVFAICALLLLAGCGGQVKVIPPYYVAAEPSPVTVEMVNAVGDRFQLRTYENCSEIDLAMSKTHAPSIAEWSGFVSRLDADKKFIESGINLYCVNKFYKRKEIIEWKDRGDPVAILSYLNNKYLQDKEICKNYDYIKNLLILAQKSKVKISNNKEYIMRTPEAYIIEKEYDVRCRGKDDGALFPEALKLNNISPKFFDGVE